MKSQYQNRLCSKTTDKLNSVLQFLEKKKYKKVLLTWDRIEDPVEGTVVVPILELG